MEDTGAYVWITHDPLNYTHRDKIVPAFDTGGEIWSNLQEGVDWQAGAIRPASLGNFSFNAVLRAPAHRTGHPDLHHLDGDAVLGAENHPRRSGDHHAGLARQRGNEGAHHRTTRPERSGPGAVGDLLRPDPAGQSRHRHVEPAAGHPDRARQPALYADADRRWAGLGRPHRHSAGLLFGHPAQLLHRQIHRRHLGRHDLHPVLCGRHLFDPAFRHQAGLAAGHRRRRAGDYAIRPCI